MCSGAVTEVEFVSGGKDGTARFRNVQSGEEEEEQEATMGLPGGRFAFTANATSCAFTDPSPSECDSKGRSREQKV
jgi:hypothetical protein